MSRFPRGARCVALAFVLTLSLTATASAGNYSSGCVLHHLQACVTTEVHTYDGHNAYAFSNDYYIASWLYHVSNGEKYSLIYGWGAAGRFSGTNTTTQLAGGWGNYSGTDNLWLTSSFDY